MKSYRLYFFAVIAGAIWGFTEVFIDAGSDTSIDAMAAVEFSETNYPSADVWVISDEKILDFEAVDIRRHEEEESGVVSMGGLKAALAQVAKEGRSVELVFPNVVELYCDFGGFQAIRSISAPRLELAYSYAFFDVKSLERLEISTNVSTVLELDQCDGCGNEVTQFDLSGVELVMNVANKRNIRDEKRLFLPPVDIIFKSILLVDESGEKADISYEPIAEDAPLSEYDYNRYPKGSRWLISEQKIESGDMSGFYNALFSVEQEGRLIDLEFTNVEVFGKGVEYRERLYVGIRPLYEIIGCRAVRSVKLPKAKVLGNRSFAGCENLLSIEMPLVEELGQMAFWGCSKLQAMELQNLQKIDWFALEFCESLTALEMPKLRSISFGAFGGCGSLRSLAISTASGVALEEVGGMEFAEVGYDKIDLTIGAANSALIDGATLSKGDFSENFSSISIQ